MLPLRSVTATITWVAPTSTARTTRAAGLKAKRDGGLPPLELASPAGPTSPEMDQGVDAGGDGGTGQPGGDCEFGPCAGLAVAEELEEIASTREIAGLLDGGISGVVSGGGCHAFSEARLLMRVMQQKFVGNISTFA